jgi:hypothetical protein
MICSSVKRLPRMVHLQSMDPTYQWQELRGARHLLEGYGFAKLSSFRQKNLVSHAKRAGSPTEAKLDGGPRRDATSP